MVSHAVAFPMHIDLSVQGSLTVQSVVFQMLRMCVVDLVNRVFCFNQSICLFVCER